MTAARRWLGHGLVVDCDTTLDLRAYAGARSPDLEVRLAPVGPVPAYGTRLPGRGLAHYDDQQGSALSVVEQRDRPERVDVCFHGVALITLDRGATPAWRASLTLAPEADPGLAGVLVSGTLLSVVLMLRGRPVLHASAAVVETAPGPSGPPGPGDVGPSAIAFVGRSGMGKSTMATLLCRDGGTLLTDDVLRTDLAADGRVLAWPGATALRLRPAARQLGLAAAGTVATTADDRFSATPTLADDTPVPLAALVVPQPDRTSDRLDVTRLTGASAVLTLAGFPRILGWTDPATSGAALRHWGELARRLPVLVLRVPWGPPFADDLGAEVAAAVCAAAAG